MPIDIAVVPVAGHGTRLMPASKSLPKEMLPVGRKPVVQYVAEELARANISRLVFVTSAKKSAIENHFDEEQLVLPSPRSGRDGAAAEVELKRQEMAYFYTRQHRQLGLGHAVLCARPLVGQQPFVVALGDSIIGLHAESGVVGRMIAEFERSNADIVVAFQTVPRQEVVRYGIADARGAVADSFVLQGIVEKPSVETAPSNLAVVGRYVFSPAIFEELAVTKPGKGGEIQLTDAMQAIIKNGGKAVGIKLTDDERRYDIGNFESYFQAFFDFAITDPEYGESLRSHVRTRMGGESKP